MKSSSVSIKEGPSLPRRRSQRTMTRAATAEERKDLRAMDREVDSATTGTFDEYSPGERSQPHTYMVYMCPAQVSFLNHLHLLCHCVVMCNSLPSIDSLNQARLEYVGKICNELSEYGIERKSNVMNYIGNSLLYSCF